MCLGIPGQVVSTLEGADEASARQAMEGLGMMGRPRSEAPPAFEMPPPPPGWEDPS
jgi:hypothetical protein